MGGEEWPGAAAAVSCPLKWNNAERPLRCPDCPQLLALAALALHSALAAPAYPGSHLGPYNNGAYFNGAYNGAAYNSGQYNGRYDGATFDPYPRYNFDYRVAEPRTGDYKNHQESRNGDAVRGQYSVAEPDGSLLTVRYAADDAHGYTAVVERSGAAGTFVQNFPGAAPLPVGAAPGYVAPVVARPVAPLAPVAPVAPALAAAHGAYGPAGAYHGGAYRPFGYHGGFGTSSTTFNGPHAAYSYTN